MQPRQRILRPDFDGVGPPTREAFFNLLVKHPCTRSDCACKQVRSVTVSQCGSYVAVTCAVPTCGRVSALCLLCGKKVTPRRIRDHFLSTHRVCAFACGKVQCNCSLVTKTGAGRCSHVTRHFVEVQHEHPDFFAEWTGVTNELLGPFSEFAGPIADGAVAGDDGGGDVVVLEDSRWGVLPIPEHVERAVVDLVEIVDSDAFSQVAESYLTIPSFDKSHLVLPLPQLDPGWSPRVTEWQDILESCDTPKTYRGAIVKNLRRYIAEFPSNAEYFRVVERVGGCVQELDLTLDDCLHQLYNVRNDAPDKPSLGQRTLRDIRAALGENYRPFSFSSIRNWVPIVYGTPSALSQHQKPTRRQCVSEFADIVEFLELWEEAEERTHLLNAILEWTDASALKRFAGASWETSVLSCLTLPRRLHRSLRNLHYQFFVQKHPFRLAVAEKMTVDDHKKNELLYVPYAGKFLPIWTKKVCHIADCVGKLDVCSIRKNPSMCAIHHAPNLTQFEDAVHSRPHRLRDAASEYDAAYGRAQGLWDAAGGEYRFRGLRERLKEVSLESGYRVKQTLKLNPGQVTYIRPKNPRYSDPEFAAKTVSDPAHAGWLRVQRDGVLQDAESEIDHSLVTRKYETFLRGETPTNLKPLTRLDRKFSGLETFDDQKTVACLAAYLYTSEESESAVTDGLTAKWIRATAIYRILATSYEMTPPIARLAQQSFDGFAKVCVEWEAAHRLLHLRSQPSFHLDYDATRVENLLCRPPSLFETSFLECPFAATKKMQSVHGHKLSPFELHRLLAVRQEAARRKSEKKSEMCGPDEMRLSDPDVHIQWSARSIETEDDIVVDVIAKYYGWTSAVSVHEALFFQRNRVRFDFGFQDGTEVVYQRVAKSEDFAPLCGRVVSVFMCVSEQPASRRICLLVRPRPWPPGVLSGGYAHGPNFQMRFPRGDEASSTEVIDLGRLWGEQCILPGAGNQRVVVLYSLLRG